MITFFSVVIVLASIGVVCWPLFRAKGNRGPKLVEDARNAALGMQNELAGKLMKEIEAKGPEGAIGVCSTLAPNAALDISRNKGWKVSRVSLKPRNALLGPADAWEQKVLLDFDARAAKGENPGALEHFEVVDEPAGRQFRYMKALPVAPLCVNCHGPQDKLFAGIRERLAKDYPAFVYLAPNPTMDARIALTRLGRILVLEDYDADRMRRFILG